MFQQYKHIDGGLTLLEFIIIAADTKRQHLHKTNNYPIKSMQKKRKEKKIYIYISFGIIPCFIKRFINYYDVVMIAVTAVVICLDFYVAIPISILLPHSKMF